jgi:protein phosphatase
LNEDAFRIVPETNLFILSDGVGGETHGEVASSMAVDTILKYCQEPISASSTSLPSESQLPFCERTSHLAMAVQNANRAIHEAATSDESLRGMAATVVAAWITHQTVSLAHVGDSRAYRLRSNILECLTRDHSLVAEQVRLGMLTAEQAEHSPLQTVLMRALGAEDHVEVDIDEHVLAEGDFVLLCSDGLSRMVSDEVIARTIFDSASAQEAADQLVEHAKDAGGSDNITVILIHLIPAPKTLLDKVWLWRKR